MSKPKSLLIVLYYYTPYVSGLSIYAKRIAEGLVKRGHKVTVLTSRHDKKLPKEEIINGVTILRRPVALKIGKGVIMPTLPLDIVRIGRQYDYINPMLPMAEIGPTLYFVPKQKTIVTYICDLYLGEGIASRFITSLSLASMRLALSRAQEVFALSYDYLRNSKMKRYIPKATGVYPIIDADEFKPAKDGAHFFKEVLGIDSKTKKIGFVGRIVYEKGINYLLNSVQYLNKELSDFKVIIVGDYKNIAGGSVKDELDMYVKLYPERIIFTGQLSDEDLKRFYTGLDVLVLPSIDPLEAFGMVQVEAMLCGAPVVTSNLPGVREVVEKTGFGLISKPKDSKDIANKIVEVLTHAEKYKPSRAKVAKIFSKETPLDTYVKMMR